MKSADEVYAIDLEGSVLRIVVGGKTSIRKFLSVDHARAQFDKVVAEKKRDGYREAPDVIADLGAREVFADELIARGDPQGELIAIGYAIERATSDRERKRLEREHARILDANHAALFGDLAPMTKPLPKRNAAHALVPTFRLGLMEEARIQALDRLHVDDVYVRLRKLTVAEHLRTLIVGAPAPPRSAGHETTYGPLFRAMTSSGGPPLTKLVLGDIAASPRARLGIGDLAPIMTLFASLESLTVGGQGLELRSAAALPKLASLDLRATSPALVDALARLDAPRLTSLTLGGYHGTELVDRIAQLPQLRTLRHLALPDAHLQDPDLEHLLDRTPDFARLESIDLRRNSFSRTLVKLVQRTLPGLRAGGR